jgi:hypothetical protein
MDDAYLENKNIKHRFDALYKIWLGRRDSNPRMPGPKPGALPLGHAPITAV